MKKVFLAAILAATTLSFNHCARNPVTGKKQVVFMSEAQEIAMGKEADPQIIAQFGLYEDSALQRFLAEKGKQMAAISHRPGLDYQFRIVNSEVINAFGAIELTRNLRREKLLCVRTKWFKEELSLCPLFMSNSGFFE